MNARTATLFSLLPLFFLLAISPAAHAQAVPGDPIFEEDFRGGNLLDDWFINGRDWLFGYELAGVEELGYAVKPRSVANSQPLITKRAFSSPSYILETSAYGFKQTYQREMRFTFGQADPEVDRGYSLRYLPASVGSGGSSLTLGFSEDNFFDLTTLDRQVINLNDEQLYRFQIARYQSGLIEVYLDEGNGYSATPILQAVDTTVAQLGHFGWGVYTQTAGADFYVFSVNAYGTTAEKIPSPEDDLIERLEVASAYPSYAVAKLNVGDTYYTDRSYLITSLPAYLQGATFVLPTNADKTETSPDYLRVFARKPVIAYVGYDPRASRVPAWLGEGAGWTRTSERIGTTDPGTRYLEVYTKVFPAGEFSPIVLGGTLADPANGAQTNYLTALVGLPEQLAYEAEDASLLGAAVATDHPGYSGTGFVDFLDEGGPEYIDWIIDIPSSGTYALEFIMAQADTTGPRPVRISVDGSPLLEEDLCPRNGWNTWNTVVPAATTRLYGVGRHRVTMETLGSSGPNVDLLVVKAVETPPAATIAQSPPAVKSPLEPAPPLMELYPNPTASRVTVTYNSSTAQISLFDLGGRLVRTFSSAGGRVSLETSGLAPGVYVIRLQGELGRVQQRLLVQ
ncbi:T9SS type A sorting domain-containing protein [Neolewinella sp.]|uniref:T9SS type A sorting domain-containing protein n=1 Tax=Neolewinella sp. TaxID=2993543 RepID=UPI003B516267